MPPIKVTLAKRYEPSPKARAKVNGWLLFTKTDGVRAYYDHKDKKFYSRTGKEYTMPKNIIDQMPTDFSLDGELTLGLGSFHVLSGYMRTIDKSSKEWPKSLHYVVFDRPSIKGTYMERMPPGLKFDSKFLVQAPYIIVNKDTDLDKLLQEAEDRGEEGLIIRNNDVGYENKRTSNLLKLTSRYSDEAVVTGYEEGSGRLEDMMGALNVVLGKNKIPFKIGTGFTDEQRTDYEELFPVGTVVTFSYKSIDKKSGVPREPAFITVRDYE